MGNKNPVDLRNTTPAFYIAPALKMFSTLSRKFISGVSSRSYKVAVLGASGGIGQPLALLLKLDPRVTELSLFDVVRTPGVAADISHVCTPAKTTGYTDMKEVGAALKGWL
jgi:hypothetical protein